MTKQQSAIDVAVGLLGDLQEAQRTGSKQAFREALRENFVRRSGASSLDQALAMAMTSLIKELIPDLSEKRSNRRSVQKRPISRHQSTLAQPRHRRERHCGAARSLITGNNRD
jgi:hypothetical protein